MYAIMPPGSSHPVWKGEQTGEPPCPPLDRNAVADICVIGGGVAGLNVAYQLRQEGLDVIVLDDGPVGGGETWRSTAHLSSAIDDRFYRIEELHGEAVARLCYESHAAAIDWYEATAAREEIDCELERVDGHLFLPPGERMEVIEREFAAARRAGARGIRWLARAPLPSFDTGSCLCFPQQGQFDPLAYIQGLAKALTSRGARICCGTHVTGIDDKNGLTVQCEGNIRVQAKSVVVATNSPINNIVTLHTKQHAYRTYAIALQVSPRSVPLALFWDTSQDAGDTSGAYHYARLQRRIRPGENESEQEILIVGGEDHKTGQADDATRRWDRLENWAQERFPITRPAKFRWSGQVMEPVDCVAFIGRNPTGPDNTYIVTGDSGMGITHAGIAAMLLGDMVMGRPNGWEKLYDPSRKSLRSAFDFARENINTVAQYLDWLRPGDVASVDDIAPGSGAIVRHGLKMLAVYREVDGSLHECSAACPHLGGVVQRNSGERTWDCPCHGSRFDRYGNGLNGPAVSPLTQMHELSEAAVRGASTRRQR